MRIALFVDPTKAEYTPAIETATFIAEVANSQGEPVVLSCGSAAALDIALALLGQAVARTVEGGERALSPIVLLPMIGDVNSEIDNRLRPSPDNDNPGTLADLVDLGLIAGREESGVDPFSTQDPLEVFVETLRDREIHWVIGLGSQSQFWRPTLRYLHEAPQGRLFFLPEFSPPDLPREDPAIVQVRPIELPDRPPFRGEEVLPDDEFTRYVVQARRQAALTAGFIETVLHLS